mgnify:CR=1 FL=1
MHPLRIAVLCAAILLLVGTVQGGPRLAQKPARLIVPSRSTSRSRWEVIRNPEMTKKTSTPM